jgi:hypothetical protein
MARIRSGLVVVGLGLLLGTATSFGQTYLPGQLSQLANCYSVWLTVSLVIGLTLPEKKAAIIGAGAVHLFALIGYYVVTDIRFNAGNGHPSTILLWSLGGMTIGPLLGWVGYEWIHKRRAILEASALIGALYVSEGLYELFVLTYAVGFLFIVLGIVGALALYRRTSSVLAIGVQLMAMTAIFYVAYAYVFTELARLNNSS